MIRAAIAGGVAVTACVTLLLGVGTSEVLAQTDPVRVEQLRLDPQAHTNQIRTVEGVVDRLVNVTGSDVPGFYLEDDFGHQLLVIPVEAPPARGERLRVTGVVTVDQAGDPVLTLFDPDAPPRAEPEPEVVPEEVPQEGVEPAADSAAQEEAGGSRLPGLFRSPVFLGAVVVVVLFLGAVFWLGRAPPPEKPLITGPTRKDPVDFATSALWPASEQEFDGRTMVFSRPDPTVRLLPGRLEVIGGGDEGEEIRFVSPDSEEIAIMFGRSAGEGPGHIQLKQQTVSRTHAVLRYRHGEWLIENLSLTNPTVLNGETLGVKERLLVDDDRIEMGEVVFRFKES